MASAASLLTPHMLTEAYTSLLAALTVWDPAERLSDNVDQDRAEMDRKRYSEAKDIKIVTATSSPDSRVKIGWDQWIDRQEDQSKWQKLNAGRKAEI